MKHKVNIPKLIKGDVVVDDRGSLRFVNDFSIKTIKRFYQVENHSSEIIRAFHGHLNEAKYVYVANGSIILCAVQLDDIESPSKNSKVERFILTATKPSVLYIPPKFANGFKTLEEGTIVLFFSTSTLEDSARDDYRYPYDYWGKDIWVIQNR